MDIAHLTPEQQGGVHQVMKLVAAFEGLDVDLNACSIDDINAALSDKLKAEFLDDPFGLRRAHLNPIAQAARMGLGIKT